MIMPVRSKGGNSFHQTWTVDNLDATIVAAPAFYPVEVAGAENDGLSQTGHDANDIRLGLGLQIQCRFHARKGKFNYRPALNPPSMMSDDPVTKAAASLARYTAAAAISSGRPIRPIGWVAAISRYAFSGSG